MQPVDVGFFGCEGEVCKDLVLDGVQKRRRDERWNYGVWIAKLVSAPNMMGNGSRRDGTHGPESRYCALCFFRTFPSKRPGWKADLMSSSMGVVVGTVGFPFFVDGTEEGEVCELECFRLPIAMV